MKDFFEQDILEESVFEEDILQDEVHRYNSLLKIEGEISQRKNFSLLALLGLFIFTIILNKGFKRPDWFYFSFNIAWSILIAIVLYIIISLYTHHRAFKYIKSEYSLPKVKFWSNINNFKKLILLIISPDYFFARTFKNSINDFYRKEECNCKMNCPSSKEEEIRFCNWDSLKNARRFFIEFSNWMNVIVTVILAFTIVFLVWGNQGFIVDIIYCLLCYRIISRSIEVLYAYFKDVVKVNSIIFEKTENDLIKSKYINNWKSSSLRKPARVSLAIHTLVEIVLVFSLFYYLTYSRMIDEGITTLTGIIGKEQSVEFYNFVLYSVSMSSFNFSFTSYSHLIWTLAHVLQVLLSMVLIVLSLAQYISTNDEMSKRDEKFFLRIKNSKQKQ